MGRLCMLFYFFCLARVHYGKVEYIDWIHFAKQKILCLLMGYGSDAFGIEAIGVVWFLAALIFAENVFNIVVRLIKNDFIIILLAFALYVVGYLANGFVVFPNWIIPQGMKFLFYFSFGYLCRQHEMIPTKDKHIIGGALIVWIAVLGYTYVSHNRLEFILQIVAIPAIIVISFLSVRLSEDGGV